MKANQEFEKRRWEFMEKSTYVILKVAEVIEFLPERGFAEMVYDRALDKYGVRLDYTEIRKVKNCLTKNKFIADVINEIGNELKHASNH